MESKMLTTIDNPYSPFTQWNQWYNFDTNVAHHGTCALLARYFDVVSNESPLLLDEEKTKIATKILISNDFDNIYRLISEKDPLPPI